MAYSKTRRQQAIGELLRSHELSSQEELAERLSAMGYSVTQATVSRDLEQIGAVKVRRAGHLAYSLPDQISALPGRNIDRMVGEWVRSIDTAVNMVVMKTPPGSAHLIGVAIDQQGMPEVVGTICGDDTIFLACRSVAKANALAKRFGQMTGIRA
jgi:transcriptional regulator of arginine metabolism